MCVTLDPDWVTVLNSLGYDLDDVRLAHDRHRLSPGEAAAHPVQFIRPAGELCRQERATVNEG